MSCCWKSVVFVVDNFLCAAKTDMCTTAMSVIIIDCPGVSPRTPWCLSSCLDKALLNHLGEPRRREGWSATSLLTKRSFSKTSCSITIAPTLLSTTNALLASKRNPRVVSFSYHPIILDVSDHRISCQCHHPIKSLDS